MKVTEQMRVQSTVGRNLQIKISSLTNFQKILKKDFVSKHLLLPWYYKF